MKTAILILAPALTAATAATVDGSASGGDSMFDFKYSETHTGDCGHPASTKSVLDSITGGRTVTYEMKCTSRLSKGVLSYDARQIQRMATFLGATADGDKLQLYGHIGGSATSLDGLTLPSGSMTGTKPKDMSDKVANDGVEMTSGMQDASGAGSVDVSNADQTDFTVTCDVDYNSAGIATGSTISRTETTDTSSASIGGGTVSIDDESSTTTLCAWKAIVAYDSSVEGAFWYGGWGSKTGQGSYQIPSTVAIPNSLYTYAHTQRSVEYTYAGFDFDTTLDQAVAAASAVPTDVANKVELAQTTHGKKARIADTLTYQMACIADLLVNPHLPANHSQNVIYSDDPFLLQTVVICHELKVNGTAHVVDQEIITSLKLSDQTDVFGDTCRAPDATTGHPTMWIPTQVVFEADVSPSDAEECNDLNAFYTASYETDGTPVNDQAVTGFEVSAVVGEDIGAADFGAVDAQFHMVNIDVEDGSSKLDDVDVNGIPGDVFYDIQTRLDTDASNTITLAEGMPFVHTRSWARVVVDTTDTDPDNWPKITDFEIKFDGGVKAILRNSGSDNPVSSS